MSGGSITHGLSRLRHSRLARNTLWMTAGTGLRLVVQAVYLVLVARTLGAEQYGAFVAVVALVGVLAPFSSLGTGTLIVKHVSRDRSVFPAWWGTALVVSLVSGIAFTLLALGTYTLILPAGIPLLMVVAIALADLFFARLAETAAQAFQAFEQLGRTAQVHLLLSLCRLGGVVLMIPLVQQPSGLEWSLLYLGSTAVAAAAAFVMVTVRLGAPRLAPVADGKEMMQGFYFSATLAAQAVYYNFDKSLLARLASLPAAGVYAAAYRVVDVAVVPLRALLAAAYPQLFRSGLGGIAGTIRFTWRIFLPALAYCAAVSAGLFLLAPLLPRLLGPGFEESVQVLRWLAVLPLLRSAHYFTSDTLTGAGHQGLRSAIQTVVAGASIGLNLILIPLYSWRGAVWAALASETLLLLCTLAAVAILYQQASTPLAATAGGRGVASSVSAGSVSK